MEIQVRHLLGIALAAVLVAACDHSEKPTLPALKNREKIPIMSTRGVSKLISDSGVIKYKIIAETWQVYDRTKPQKQTFPDGIFMIKYDSRFKVEMYLTADTAYWYDQNLWELRGRVEMQKSNGTSCHTEELFWDMGKHEIYSSRFVSLVTPQQDLRGTGFRSDEELSKYEVINSAGSFPVPEEKKQEDTVVRQPDIPGGNAQVPIASKPADKTPQPAK
jgi:LPS export ABC transporter protein LptC